MPRANRHFLPGHVWHITHRCHNRQFLLQESADRRQWLDWLRTAQTRYGLPILGYTVTCNHIHLLMQDPGDPDAIARSMQFVQGRSAQQYNRSKGRQSGFWGDRYHATAVESGSHLLRCLAYIDLNMVRAGVVSEPGEWFESGFREIQMDRVRQPLVDRHRLAMLVGAQDLSTLRRIHRDAITDALKRNSGNRDGRWTESLAVGSQQFVTDFATRLGTRTHGRSISETVDTEAFVLNEPQLVIYGSEESRFMAGDNSVALESEPEMNDD